MCIGKKKIQTYGESGNQKNVRQVVSLPALNRDKQLLPFKHSCFIDNPIAREDIMRRKNPIEGRFILFFCNARDGGPKAC